MANHGNILGISLCWPIDLIHNFFAAENVIVSGRGFFANNSIEPMKRPGLGDASKPYYESLCMPVPIIALLNAAGIIKFIRLRAFSSTQTCNPRLPGSHTPGVN